MTSYYVIIYNVHIYTAIAKTYMQRMRHLDVFLIYTSSEKKKKEPRETLISFAAANAGYIIELFAFHFIVFSALTSIAWL